MGEGTSLGVKRVWLGLVWFDTKFKPNQKFQSKNFSDQTEPFKSPDRTRLKCFTTVWSDLVYDFLFLYFYSN